jgi:3-phenylpropionate/cinnamic acid dioxygenase small subunit
MSHSGISSRATRSILSNKFENPAILDEDRRYLEMRLAKPDTGMAWAEDPPSRTTG